MSVENNPDKIIIHHSADTSPESQLEKINAAHKQREFPISSLGMYVGYHYLIAHDGSITPCRKLTDEGAHCRGENFSSIGICLEGNFDVEFPTEKQQDALFALLDGLLTDLGLKSTDIYPHRAFSFTDCFGMKLSPDWPRMLYTEYKGAQLNQNQPCALSMPKK